MEFLKLLTLLSLVFYYSCSKSQDSKDASEGDDIEMVDGEEASGDEDVEVVDSEEGYDDEEGFMEEDEEGYEDDEELADGEDEESWDDEEEYADEDGEESDEEDEELAEDFGESEGVEELEAAEGDVVADSDPDFESLDGAPLMGGADNDMPVAQEAPIPAPAVNIADAGPTSTYSVQSNETLMLISFKLYGDYTRWNEIQRLNSDKLGGSTVISPGMQLSYNTQGSGFVWNPQGRPYLIQRGDTLGIISDKVYNTMSKWRKIWDNNKPLIKDPNKIYAGFTLYYVPEDGRDLASEGAKQTVNIPAPKKRAESAPAPVEESFEEEDFPEEI